MAYLNPFGLETNNESAAYAREIQGRDHIYDKPLESIAKLYLQETGFACLEICYSFAWVPFVEMTEKLRPRLGGLAEGLIMSIDRLCEVAGFWRNFTIVGQRLECGPHTL